MVELAEEIVQDIINYLTTHQAEIGVMTMLLFRNKILNNIKYVIFSSIKRVSAKKWKFESLDIPINFDGIKEEYITENGARKRSIILTGNMFTDKEKHNLNQIIGLWKNEKWGYVTILEPDKNYLTFCNIRAVQKDKKTVSYIQPFKIELEIIGTSRTHSQGFEVKEMRKVKNDWGI